MPYLPIALHPKPPRLAVGAYVRQLIRFSRCGDAAARVPREHLSGRRYIHSARNRFAGGFSLVRGDRIMRECPGPEVGHGGVPFVGRDVNEVFAVGIAGAAGAVPMRRNNSTEPRAQSAVEAIVCDKGAACKEVRAWTPQSAAGPSVPAQLEQNIVWLVVRRMKNPNQTPLLDENFTSRTGATADSCKARLTIFRR